MPLLDSTYAIDLFFLKSLRLLRCSEDDSKNACSLPPLLFLLRRLLTCFTRLSLRTVKKNVKSLRGD